MAAPAPGDDTQALFETTLIATESLIEYRRRHRSDLALDAVIDLLLIDDANPRSLAFQLDRLREDLVALPHGGRGDDHVALVDASARVLLDVATTPLAAVVLDARAPLLTLVEGITSRWFGDEAAGRRFQPGAG
jgi:uncharacterized alpha-E superfamily protein